MGNRHKAREFTLQVLFALDLNPQPVGTSMLLFWRDLAVPDEVRTFSDELVNGVKDSLKEIDTMLAEYSENWTIDRMTGVDRNILRMAIYELLHRPEIPRNVTINEAVEIGKKFGSEDSGAFVNGILDRIAKDSGK
jgi:transcription antitermination protein NusB